MSAWQSRVALGGRTLAFAASVLLAGMAAATGSQTAEPPPGVDWSELDEDGRALFVKIAEEQFCPCGKSRSFLHAMQAPDDCPAATRLGQRMAASIAKGDKKRVVMKKLLRDVASLNARFTFDTSKSPRLGAADAPIEVVVFSDFECPYCRRAAADLVKIAKRADDVALVYKFFPLGFHKHARGAALATLAADRQGKFWPMHDAIYERSETPDEELLDKLAKELKLDVKQWKKDQLDPALQVRLSEDKREGERAGIQGTPTFFVNGLIVERIDDLAKRIAQEREAPKR